MKLISTWIEYIPKCNRHIVTDIRNEDVEATFIICRYLYVSARWHFYAKERL